MSIRKVKMATAILILLLNAAKRGHSSDMLKKPYIEPAQSKVTYSSRSKIPPWVVLLAAPRPSDTH
jgi:hypothetical protein